MAEEHLGLSDESTVNPFLGGGTTGLADDSAKVTFGETHTIGIVANLVMLAAVLAASFLPVAAFADEGGAGGNSVGNEAVDQPAASDQPAATEPEAPAESEAQPAATELEAFADQPDTEDGSNDKQKSGGDSELKGISESSESCGSYTYLELR